MNHGCTADDYIFIVTHAQFIHYFVEANIIGTRCRKPLLVGKHRSRVPTGPRATITFYYTTTN